MRYVSTRGQAPVLDFEGVTLTGLASDGGLYLPQEWPQFSRDEIAALRGFPYSELAVRIMGPFVGDSLTEAELRDLCQRAYGNFSHAATTPLVQLDEQHWLLELFHGPTLAFKDVALQLLGLFFETFLEKRERPLTIIGATSGDTGSAAIAAIADRANIGLVMLHPEGRVSEIQRRQMTTVDAPNIVNLAVRGSFDDCQRIVKQLFASGVGDLRLGAVNSINWLRIAGQVPYYFAAAAKLNAVDRPLAFAVPTGNFGNAFAGHVARAMGLPVERLIVASNANAILPRTIATGLYERGEALATSAPAMDIQVASNFERLLFEADPAATPGQMELLSQEGRFHLTAAQRRVLDAMFAGASAHEGAIADAMRWARDRAGQVIDPHTAAGLHAALASDLPHDVPIVTLATAHPAKFPDAVAEALGERPAAPERLRAIFGREERYATVDADPKAVASHLEDIARTLA